MLQSRGWRSVCSRCRREPGRRGRLRCWPAGLRPQARARPCPLLEVAPGQRRGVSGPWASVLPPPTEGAAWRVGPCRPRAGRRASSLPHMTRGPGALGAALPLVSSRSLVLPCPRSRDAGRAVPHAGAPGRGLQPLCVLPEHAGKPGETVSALGSVKHPPCHQALPSSVPHPLVLPQNPRPENHAGRCCPAAEHHPPSARKNPFLRTCSCTIS